MLLKITISLFCILNFLIYTKDNLSIFNLYCAGICLGYLIIIFYSEYKANKKFFIYKDNDNVFYIYRPVYLVLNFTSLIISTIIYFETRDFYLLFISGTFAGILIFMIVDNIVIRKLVKLFLKEKGISINDIVPSVDNIIK